MKPPPCALLLPILVGLGSACTPSLQGSRDPARLAAVRRVVVLPFATPEGAPRSLADGFADEISSELGGARFAVVDRGADASADAVLIGRVVAYHDQAVTHDLDTSLAVSVRIVDVRTNEVVLSTSSNATAAATFCAQEMTCLRGKVMTAIGRFIVEGGK
jgi:hypothetical protein